MITQTRIPTVLMTAFPAGNGPYERYEVTVEVTGEVLFASPMPIDREAVSAACAAFRARFYQQ